MRIKTIGPNGGVRYYNSLSATSRVLSGNGTEAKRFTIARRVAQPSGGVIGNVIVSRVK